MAGHNRYLRGSTNDLLARVRGNIVVESGDFMYRNTLVSNDAYPLSENKTATAGTAWAQSVYANFLGVAMEGSISGVTENITIATSGIFRYPIVGAYSAVTVGSLVSAVTAKAGSGGSDQWVVNHSTQSTTGTTAYLGYCVKTESGASFIDFQLRTAFGPGGSAS